ncbi:hypothetical protein CCH79_00016561 [Gambusia affinis]|uniref:Uncharacterized protein n=1 Tax=Gambusia affinis TaxID=33528 RepID=A0A315V9R9_GAMAF|nr:hypothetical protein CCH79_00016561 [Gambusia affinis]
MGGGWVFQYNNPKYTAKEKNSDFNTIILSKLVRKLEDLGLPQNICYWIKDFLTDLSKRVRVGFHLSLALNTNTRSPQGCVLSLLFYTLNTRASTKAPHRLNLHDEVSAGSLTTNAPTNREHRQTLSAQTATRWAACSTDKETNSPTMLHVGGLVHADGQFDPQICVLAVLRDHHPVELRLLWTTGGGDQDHLKVVGRRARGYVEWDADGLASLEK